MKLAWAFLGFAATAIALRGEWKDLRPGMDAQAALKCVGAPLLQNHGRGAFDTWTYDGRGYIQFEKGKVVYWEPTQPAKTTTPPASAIAAKAVPAKNPRSNIVAARD